jgi:aryl-alcohol dehydrogenase-like predicted oxidoreductase
VHLLAYSPLLGGAYAGRGRPLGPEYTHAANRARLAVLGEVARELGATANQVVLAWLLARPGIIPIPGASSVEQLDEILGATELTLDEATLARLDEAGRADQLGSGDAPTK